MTYVSFDGNQAFQFFFTQTGPKRNIPKTGARLYYLDQMAWPVFLGKYSQLLERCLCI